MILASRATSRSGRFNFDGQVMSLNALYEQFPCLYMIPSSKSKVDFSLLGVFDLGAFFRGIRIDSNTVVRIQPSPLSRLHGLQNLDTCAL